MSWVWGFGTLGGLWLELVLALLDRLCVLELELEVMLDCVRLAAGGYDVLVLCCFGPAVAFGAVVAGLLRRRLLELNLGGLLLPNCDIAIFGAAKVVIRPVIASPLAVSVILFPARSV